MNQLCKVCGEPAAGFHFGAFTCEGCKSFFGRSYNNLSSISECKNNGKCIIDKKNRTTCKACRLRKCYMVGMSKSGSRYGRRSNWFKIHCLLQQQQQQEQQHQQQQQQHHQQQQQQQNCGSMDAAKNNVGPQFGTSNSDFGMSGVMGGAGVSGYPGMSAYQTPFVTQPHGHHNPADIMAAAMPFFRMMHSLPPGPGGVEAGGLGSGAHFPLPPQLLFCPDPTIAAAAAAAAYRAEAYNKHHRRSVDSNTSSESQRYSPYGVASALASAHARGPTSPTTGQNMGKTSSPIPGNILNTPIARQSPELCVYSSDDDQVSVSCTSPIATSNNNSVHDVETRPSLAQQPTPPLSHAFPSPVSVAYMTQSPKILATPTDTTTTPTPSALSESATATSEEQRQSFELSSFTHKIQSLSPVSVCSISAEYQTKTPQASSLSTSSASSMASTALTMPTKLGEVTSLFYNDNHHDNYQEGPMDLSMKNTNTNNGKSIATPCNQSQHPKDQEQISDNIKEDHHGIDVENKKQEHSQYFLSPTDDNCSSDAHSSNDMEREREKESVGFHKSSLSENNNNKLQRSFSSFTPLRNTTSLRGIFVCV